MLNCQSIEDTLAFYQQILQFVVVKKRESNGKLQWAHIMHGGTTLMLQAAEPHVSESVHNQNPCISLYLIVNNINELHHFVKAKYSSVSEIKITDYQMQEFSLTDPDSNTVTVGMA